MEKTGRRQQHIALRGAPDQGSMIDRIHDADQLDAEGLARWAAVQVGDQVGRRGLGLQVRHMGLLGHPVRAGEAA
ncbi:hypothetical protein SDC9_204008 [bioreactor metagenome]|uniref:Uncharacterized protein n=1 Tax=bioreactor metagenome TaxID=1076179 RepID=A0A645IZI9_9ZZZZ